MLPSASRLRRRSSFDAVYRKGRSAATDLVVVYVRPNRAEATRFGFSVSKKLGKSVARNVVKRRLREAARAMLAEIGPGYDVVVIARSGAGSAEFTRLSESLRAALRKAGIMAGGRAS